MRKVLNYKFLLCFALATGISLIGLAQEKEAALPPAGNGNSLVWGLGVLLLSLFFGLLFLVNKMASLGKEEQSAFSLKTWWAAMDARLFTKAIPIEKESEHILDHEYDGIRELDNSLPPWWKYGFYVSIVFSVFYLLRYHVWKTGPDPEQEYNTEMAIAARQVEEYRKKAGEMVDEKTVTLADAKGIAEGEKLFQTTCMACHGGKGEGGVGPNLTDKFWLHGGSINDVFKTIKYGVPEKGMQAWEKTYSPSQIRNIASYIKSITGTNPPNGKAPQGDPFEENEISNPVAKDSSAIAKK